MSAGTGLLISGVVMLGIASFVDFDLRDRMARIGRKRALFQGGAFDYRHFNEVRKKHGWAVWPVYLMWSLAICGIALTITGFFLHFGIAPLHR